MIQSNAKTTATITEQKVNIIGKNTQYQEMFNPNNFNINKRMVSNITNHPVENVTFTV